LRSSIVIAKEASIAATSSARLWTTMLKAEP
jgi:hypothetical protein